MFQKFESKEKQNLLFIKMNPIKVHQGLNLRKTQNGSRMKMKLENIETLSQKCSSHHRPPIFIVVQSISACLAGVFGMDHRLSGITHFFIFGFPFFGSQAMFPSIPQKYDLPHFSLKSKRSFSLNMTTRSVALPFIATIREEIIV